MALPSFGVQLIEGKILSEIKKLIENKVSTVFLASVLPPAEPDAKGKLRVDAELKLVIRELVLDYTAHAGKDERRELPVEIPERVIEIHTAIPAKKPSAMNDASTMPLELRSLALDCVFSGVEFKQTMMGVGATAHGVHAVLEISGTGKAVWME